MHRTRLKSSLLALLLCVGAAHMTIAQERDDVQAASEKTITRTDFYQLLTANENWNALTMPSQDGGSLCAIFARPVAGFTFRDETMVNMDRGERIAFVTWTGPNRSARSGEISFSVGAPVVKGTDTRHLLVVDKQIGFNLIGDEDRLTLHPQDDAAAIDALRRGVRMFVQAHLKEGEVVRDAYSLIGLSAATSQMLANCN